MFQITLQEELEEKVKSFEAFRFQSEAYGEVYLLLVHEGELTGRWIVQYMDGQDGSWVFGTKEAALVFMFNLLTSHD